ncbi:MAG: hypothetical protein DRQ99_08150 [Candidatus Parabeggiatoa sp. nov. 3]|nr:MAG: hypothetical protein DRQ99_08150 [Gammaproteobacteria bacterium]
MLSPFSNLECLGLLAKRLILFNIIDLNQGSDILTITDSSLPITHYPLPTGFFTTRIDIMRKTIRSTTTAPQSPTIPATDSNLPAQQAAGFFGREQELQQIERVFVKDKTRRLTITGMSGQGKSSLAIEAGQRLYHSGQFKKICLVDYGAFSKQDAVDLAIKTLARVLDSDLVNVVTATEALKDIPTLLILDNLDMISLEQLPKLLEVAEQCSEVGACRLLLTSEQAEFEQFGEFLNNHHILPLSGLAKADALAYFEQLLALPPITPIKPPKSAEVLSLFKQVAFHPLSIGVLAIALKTLPPQEVERRLPTLLEQDDPFWALLKWALENLIVEIELTGALYWLAILLKRNTKKPFRLDAKTVRFLPRLSVFQGGVFEPDLLEITEVTKKQWYLLCSALQTAGLIKLEFLPDFKVPYIKFHPTLSPTLWPHFSSAEEQAFIFSDYQQRYAQLAAYMAYEESKNMVQVHALVQHDFSNLLHAVHSALDAEEVWAVQFVKNLNIFLNYFGFQRDSAILGQRAEIAQSQKKKK